MGLHQQVPGGHPSTARGVDPVVAFMEVDVGDAS